MFIVEILGDNKPKHENTKILRPHALENKQW